MSSRFRFYHREIYMHFKERIEPNVKLHFLASFPLPLGTAATQNDCFSLQEYYDTFDDAYHATKKGKIWGFIYFTSNFTESLQDVRDNVRDAEPGSYDNQEIKVYLDKSDQQVTFFLEKKLLEAYKNFAEYLMTECQLPKQLANAPINFETPLYGTFDDEFTNFMAPGVIMT